MADKKEVTIKGANEQRFQIKNAADQEGAKLEVGRIQYANTQAANLSDDRSLLGIVLDGRDNPGSATVRLDKGERNRNLGQHYQP